MAHIGVASDLDCVGRRRSIILGLAGDREASHLSHIAGFFHLVGGFDQVHRHGRVAVQLLRTRGARRGGVSLCASRVADSTTGFPVRADAVKRGVKASNAVPLGGWYDNGRPRSLLGELLKSVGVDSAALAQ
ncbi:hypothetical protein PG984_007475 [Apiospora sp. TS-2023a]